MDNIKMNLLEIGWGSVDWIGLVENKMLGNYSVASQLVVSQVVLSSIE
jgi:hypothetical protein